MLHIQSIYKHTHTPTSCIKLQTKTLPYKRREIQIGKLKRIDPNRAPSFESSW